MKLVEIQPLSLLTTLSVLSRRSLMSFCWFSGSTVRMLIRVVTFFVTSMVVFMMFSSKSVVLCPYTMKTILLVTTDRSGKKKMSILCESPGIAPVRRVEVCVQGMDGRRTAGGGPDVVPSTRLCDSSNRQRRARFLKAVPSEGAGIYTST